MKTTQLLATLVLITAVAACSKTDTQEKPMESVPEATPTSTLLPNEIKPDDTTTPVEQNDSGKKVIFWYDPMMPERHFSKSGQSPFMDMKLAPQYEVGTSKGSAP